MENNKNENASCPNAGKEQTAPADAKLEELKAKYGKVYCIAITIPVDDDTETVYAYHFKRPSVPSYDRYIKSAPQAGITKASKAFLLDAVVDEDRDRLVVDMEENPGLTISIGNKLTDILGMTNSVNLKLL